MKNTALDSYKTKKVREAVKKMPYFTMQSLLSLSIESKHLKVILSRMKKRGEIVSLKKGVYSTSEYIEDVKRSDHYTAYLEFLANIIYSPSYLSGEYILSEHGVLSESFYGFSSVTVKKTNKISNELGSFYYYSVKEDLFCGFKGKKIGDTVVYKATLAKALFDFLYLRKNSVVNDSYLSSLRLNTQQISRKDIKEFNGYVKKEGSKKMIKIAKFYAN